MSAVLFTSQTAGSHDFVAHRVSEYFDKIECFVRRCGAIGDFWVGAKSYPPRQQDCEKLHIFTIYNFDVQQNHVIQLSER